MFKLFYLMGLLSVLRLFTGCSDSAFFASYGYNVQHGKVFFKRAFPDPVLRMDDVDVKSFQVIKGRAEDSAYADNGYYATDKRFVYYKGYTIDGSDGPSFQIVDINFSKDKNQCYYRGGVITGADPASFISKGDDFSADKGHIFRREVTIDNDTSVFERYHDGYLVRTLNAVSVYQDLVPIPKGATFKYFAFDYFAIGNQLYFHEDPMPDGDVNSFEALTNFFSRTKNHVYYGNNIITNANPATHQMMEPPYSKDDQHIYFFERTIEGADIKTFEIINTNFQCSRDKHAVYHEDKKIIGFTGEDLTNKNNCTKCNETAIYFAEPDSVQHNQDNQ